MLIPAQRVKSKVVSSPHFTLRALCGLGACVKKLNYSPPRRKERGDGAERERTTQRTLASSL